MAAYYNDFEPYVCEWLRNLIKAGLIPDGDVDNRSIRDVQPEDLRGYKHCHFFAGIGGWAYALRLAQWPDDREVWTGSCPCQPFSVAGKQKGFADDRHLWPEWYRLIGQCRPPILFGEQVAGAAQWLGLVRSDLEGLGYAVGAMPIEAASAGADHLRDRFWLVGHDTRQRRGEGRPEHELRSGRTTATGDGGSIDLAHAHDARSQGRSALRECSGQRSSRPDGLANTYELGGSERREQRSGQLCGLGGDTEARDSCDLANGAGERRDGGENSAGQTRRISAEDGGYDWAIGADGKARRVKPGIRLLAHGVPSRVAKLRAFGNAIDPRPASEFIKACM